MEAVIKKRHLREHSYKVSFVSPLTGRKETKWLMVDDITSLTLEEEKRKQMAAKLTKQQKKQYRNKYLVSMESVDFTNVIKYCV